MIAFHHLRSELTPADILSKHCGYQQVWLHLHPILFWQGDTADLIDKNTNGGDVEEE